MKTKVTLLRCKDALTFAAVAITEHSVASHYLICILHCLFIFHLCSLAFTDAIIHSHMNIFLHTFMLSCLFTHSFSHALIPFHIHALMFFHTLILSCTYSFTHSCNRNEVP